MPQATRTPDASANRCQSGCLIYQTTLWLFTMTAVSGRRSFDLRYPGNIYSQSTNPTTDVKLEQRGKSASKAGWLLLCVGSQVRLLSRMLFSQHSDGRRHIVAANNIWRRHLQSAA